MDLAFEILVVTKTFQCILKDTKHVSNYIKIRVCVSIHTIYDTTENTTAKPCDLNVGLFNGAISVP